MVGGGRPSAAWRNLAWKLRSACTYIMLSLYIIPLYTTPTGLWYT